VETETLDRILTTGFQELPTRHQVNHWLARLEKVECPAEMDANEFEDKKTQLRKDLKTLASNWPTGIIKAEDVVEQKLRGVLGKKWAAANRLAKNFRLLYQNTIEENERTGEHSNSNSQAVSDLEAFRAGCSHVSFNRIRLGFCLIGFVVTVYFFGTHSLVLAYSFAILTFFGLIFSWLDLLHFDERMRRPRR
jgi:hypothetical protein